MASSAALSAARGTATVVGATMFVVGTVVTIVPCYGVSTFGVRICKLVRHLTGKPCDNVEETLRRFKWGVPIAVAVGNMTIGI